MFPWNFIPSFTIFASSHVLHTLNCRLLPAPRESLKLKVHFWSRLANRRQSAHVIVVYLVSLACLLRACSSRVAPRVALTRAVASGAVLTAGAMVISVAKPATAEAEAVPFTGLPGTPHERSFVALKPDAVQRGLIGDIIKR